MNKCADRFEDSRPPTNECVDFSWLTSTLKHVLCYCILFLLLWSLWRQAIIVLRGSKPWGLENFVGTAASSKSCSCMYGDVPGRLFNLPVCACIYAASCAFLIHTPHDTMSIIPMTVSFSNLPLI